MAKPPLEIELTDGKILHPTISAESEILEYERNGAHYAEFHQLRWADEKGETIPDFLSSFRHEFWPDGTAFCTGFFMVENDFPPDIKRFELSFSPDFSAFDDLRWAMCYRPEVADGSLIQTAAPERFIERGSPRKLEEGIFPQVNFNARQQHGNSIYAEFFMEAGNTISGQKDENCSSITWANGNPVLSWNFQNKPCSSNQLPWQWRNHWGWVITQAPHKRHLPPMTMYHFFDNFKRYPDRELLTAMADSGCNVLAMHENWRLDPQNGGDPYDEKRFRELVKTAHEYNIRVMVYIRGNENAIVEDHGAWFHNYLKYNFDGLYMDYGGPFHQITPPDECYHNGRIHLRKHYLTLRKVRETIGADGIFYSHTGPMFSALGMGLMDGYVSGEGERGILIKGRPEHEYFSMAPVTTGTMWTAAFPEYGSARMTPFLAATGQYPHNPIGQQMKSASLSHPPEPGINDIAFRPLWKLWSCLRDEQDLAVFNDYNSRGIFKTASDACGHYLMISKDKRKALLVLTNFSDHPQAFKPEINWSKTGFIPDNGFLLQPDTQSPGIPSPYTGEMVKIGANGVAGIFYAPDGAPVHYAKPYHRIGTLGLQWLDKVTHQRELRKNPPPWAEVYLSACLAPGVHMPYEESLIYDILDNQLELGVYGEDGSFRPLGWLGKERFVTSGPPEKRDQIWRHDQTMVIPLHEYLPKGLHKLAIRSWHGKELFYSFIEAKLSPDFQQTEGYTIEFYNDLEFDRAYLTWWSAIS